jgi:hypothetical protein
VTKAILQWYLRTILAKPFLRAVDLIIAGIAALAFGIYELITHWKEVSVHETPALTAFDNCPDAQVTEGVHPPPAAFEHQDSERSYHDGLIRRNKIASRLKPDYLIFQNCFFRDLLHACQSQDSSRHLVSVCRIPDVLLIRHAFQILLVILDQFLVNHNLLNPFQGFQVAPVPERFNFHCM